MPIQKRTQRTKAFHLYMTTNLQQKEIAEAVGVNRRTVGEWVRNFNWADQKRTTYYSPEQIINQLFEELRVIDQNINRREPELRVATKEENEQRARLSALITAHLKNSGVNWRNTAPEYEYKNDNIIDLSALSALEKKNLEKRKKIAEEDANTSYGKRFSEEDLEEYYTKVALQLPSQTPPAPGSPMTTIKIKTNPKTKTQTTTTPPRTTKASGNPSSGTARP